MRNKYNLSLSFYVNVIIGMVFILSAVCIVVIIDKTMRQQALSEAEIKAKLILDRNLATHTYFSHNLKPAVFKLTDPYRSAEYFDPVWMSSTYAIREIDGYFKTLETDNYYYKECAINARSPSNEADAYEKAFITQINADKQLIKKTEVREIDGKQFFVVLRRGEVMEQSCLRCHDTPERAPQDLVNLYGPERSFSRKEGEVVSAISIRIPIDIPIAHANTVTWELSLGLLVILLFLFGCQYMIHRRIVIAPLNKLQKMAIQIATDEERIGEEVNLGFSRELRGLSSAFNKMSKQLREHIDSIENRVRERTGELSTANELLTREIELRKASESEKEGLILELEKALQEIKTLSGILPLCSFCKKIRNNTGEWENVDSYIHTHSEADVSHSVCPDCIKKHYPEFKNE